MPRKQKAPKASTRSSKGKQAKVSKSESRKAAKPKAKKTAKPARTPQSKIKKPRKPKKTAAAHSPEMQQTAQILASEVVFSGPLFRVLRDRLIEPGGKEGLRDIIRHNGSVVILALDTSQSKKDPYIVVERQYRHAANQFLWELPAGKLEPGEDPLAGAQRELEEETGYKARKWKPLVEYYASPGFLGESMKVFLAEGLVAGNPHPEDDEQIEIRLVKLSEVLKMIEKGAILDGKTLSSVLLFTRLFRNKKKK